MSSSDDTGDGDPYYAAMSRLRKLEMWRTAVADGDWGLPTECPCGARIVEEVITTETEKKRYLTCVKYEDDGLHRRKYWVDAIEEETKSLKQTVDGHAARIREFASHDVQIAQLKDRVQAKDEEVAKLKELVQAKDDEIERIKDLLHAFDSRILTLEHCCFDSPP